MSLFRYNPKSLLEAYAYGLFPTLNPNGEFILYKPRQRALLPVNGIKICKSLRSVINKGAFEVRFDTAFDAVVGACIRPFENWITPELQRVYGALHQQGWAHSVECFNEQGELVGGLYGIAIGGVFFSESSFSLVSQASKFANYALVELCRSQGFSLIDVQMQSDHLMKLGAYEMSDDQFQLQLSNALQVKTQWGFNLSELRKLVFPPRITDGLVMIRGLVESDAEALLQMNQNPLYYQHIHMNPLKNHEQVAEYIRNAIEINYFQGIPDPLGICLVGDPGRIIGTGGGFTPYQGLPQMEFVLDLDPNFWGKGYAVAAGRMIIDYLFANYPVRRLQGRQAIENVAALKMATKLGLKVEGVLRDVMYFAGRTSDLRYLSMTYDDWLDQRTTATNTPSLGATQ